MDRDPQKAERKEQISGPKRHERGVASPIPEPRFEVGKKKVRKESVEEADKARALPFELDLNPISSRNIPPLQLLAGLRDDWTLQPESLDNLQTEFVDIISPTTLEIPSLKIWESARLSPTTPLHKTIDTLEIRLPPRILLSVEPMEVNLGAEDVSSDIEEDSRSASEIQTKEQNVEVADSKGGGEEIAPQNQGARAPPPLYEFLFETSGGSITYRKPICIVAAKRDDDRYQKTLETLCREQFRQYVGGKPLADLLAANEANSVEKTRIQNRIVSHDDSDSDFFKFQTKMGDSEITRELIEEEGEGDLARLRSRIDEFFTANLGYLLLFVEDRYADVLYEHLVSVEDIRESNAIILLQLRQLPDDVKRDIVSLAWGNVSLSTNRRDLDSLFHNAEDRFSVELEPRGEIEEITRKDSEESILHYWVKCFVVDYLLSRENLKPLENYSRPKLKERILTEEPPWDDSDLRPDICINRTKEVFEIETLYGTDHKKINRTIDKYEGTNVKQINVVLPNLTCLRNLEAVLRKTQEERGEMFENDVEFWTLDLENSELLSINEVTGILNEMNDRVEHLM